MFLGGATKRKLRDDADLQNDEVLGELLGQIGSTGTKKSETTARYIRIDITQCEMS